MRAKKSFGQHFLTNEDIARRIAGSLACLKPGEKPNVLEIGPGRGMLTKFLLQQEMELLVVEADRDMVAYLGEHYPALHGKIIAEDILRLDFTRLFPSPSGSQQFCIIGNFPYNISSQIVFKMLENRSLVPELAGMFQKEMAERIIAKPGGKDYGVISVLTQAFYEGKMLFTVGNRNFNPPPKVQSAVIRLTRRETNLPDCNEAMLRRVVKQAFSQRRKMLRNTMKDLIGDPVLLEGDFFKKRPEELSVADFAGLTQLVERQTGAAARI